MSGTAPGATVLIVPGLRDEIPEHWQTHLARRLPGSRTVPPMGRNNLACAMRVDALETEAAAIRGPIVVVAHSAGVLTVVHWAAQRTRRTVHGALLAVPPDFEAGLPRGYPQPEELHAAGWLPLPRSPLPFPSIVAASRNDPLASFACVAELALAWRSRLVDLGYVGHLNPASGFGEWHGALPLIVELDPAMPAEITIAAHVH